MKAEELRLANKFMFRTYANGWVETELNSDSITDAGEYGMKYFLSHYKPIKITEKHLVGLGFESLKDFSLSDYSSLVYDIIEDKTLIYFCQLNNRGVIEKKVCIGSFEYIHQIQNLITDLK